MNTGNVAAFTDALANVWQYADNSVQYPDLDRIKRDDGVVAEWFYDIFNGSNAFSELSAILLYTGQEAKFEQVSDLLLGIGLVEMKHYDKLQDLIRKLGGTAERRYDNSAVKLGATVEEALQTALDAERETIVKYRAISARMEEPFTKTAKTVLALIGKIVADEELHERLLVEQLDKLKTDV